MEKVSREIPEGRYCGECSLHDSTRCTLFNEPYDYRKKLKNEYCYNNRHIGTVHRAWKAEGRTEK